MTKQLLQKIIKVMFLSLIALVLFMLLRSLGGPSNIGETVNLYDDVLIGQTAKRRDGASRVWVTRLSKAQLRQRAELSNHVVESNSGCNAQPMLCVVLAKTEKSGIDIVYSATSPDGFPADVPWYGGFVDPYTGETYDVFGRAYKTTYIRKSALQVL